MALSTDFKDDILASSNSKRKFNMIHNDDGTVSFEDVTVYSQIGSNYGAKEVIEERKAINDVVQSNSELNRKLDSKFAIKTTILSNMTVNGGTTASKTVSVALDGYKPLFIGYPNWVGPNSGYTLLYGCHLEDNDNLVFNMRNMGTNAASITASFPIWYTAI